MVPPSFQSKSKLPLIYLFVYFLTIVLLNYLLSGNCVIKWTRCVHCTANMVCSEYFWERFFRDFLWKLFRFGSTVGFEFTLVINFCILNLSFFALSFCNRTFTMVPAFYAQLVWVTVCIIRVNLIFQMLPIAWWECDDQWYLSVREHPHHTKWRWWWFSFRICLIWPSDLLRTTLRRSWRSGTTSTTKYGQRYFFPT